MRNGIWLLVLKSLTQQLLKCLRILLPRRVRAAILLISAIKVVRKLFFNSSPSRMIISNPILRKNLCIRIFRRIIGHPCLSRLRTPPAIAGVIHVLHAIKSVSLGILWKNLNLNSKNLSSRCLIVGHLRASSFSEAAGIATSPRSSPRLSSRAHRGLDRWGSSTLQIPRTPPPRCSRLCICIILVFIWTRIPFPARSR
jgi:hypothetical protein